MGDNLRAKVKCWNNDETCAWLLSRRLDAVVQAHPTVLGCEILHPQVMDPEL
jgi:hypothetical protein